MRNLGSFFFSDALVCLTAGLILFVVPGLPGCGSCTAMGCSSGTTLSIDMAADLLIPEGSTATACFNDTCVVGVLPASTVLLPVSDPGIRFAIRFPERSGVAGTVGPHVTSRDRVQITWSFEDAVRLGAGDRYRVTVTDPAGVTIATKEATAVSYDTYEPNGSSCEPTCHRAQFP